MKKLLLIVLILFSVSCKSIKKNKQVSINTQIENNSVKSDSSSLKTYDSINIVKDETLLNDQEEITETIEEGSKVIKVNNVEVIVPNKVVTTKIKRNSSFSDTKLKQSELKKIDLLQLEQSDTTNKNDLSEDFNLEKESEGMSIIQEVLSGLIDGFLGWGKYLIVGILGLVLFYVVKKQLDKK